MAGLHMRIDRGTRDKLRLYAAMLTIKTGRAYTFSEAVQHLLDNSSILKETGHAATPSH